jgi:hypothetical protein
MEVSGQHKVLATLPSGKTLVHIEEETGWAPQTFWTLWRREKSFVPTGIRIPDRPSRSVLAIPIPSVTVYFIKYCQVTRTFKTRHAICIWRIIEAPSLNHYCCGKAISITYSECTSVALVIQHAQRMRRLVLSSETCLAVPQFSTLSYKLHDLREKSIQHKTCVLTSSTTFVWNIFHPKKNSARYCHKCA